jgi:DNA-directed RNA polymerase specialized sigma24 family protein
MRVLGHLRHVYRDKGTLIHVASWAQAAQQRQGFPTNFPCAQSSDRLEEVAGKGESVEDQVIARIDMDTMESRLPDWERKALRLRLLGYTEQEIARSIGRMEGEVRRLFASGLRPQIRELMAAGTS